MRLFGNMCLYLKRAWGKGATCIMEPSTVIASTGPTFDVRLLAVISGHFLLQMPPKSSN
jgi:hypothetical protein